MTNTSIPKVVNKSHDFDVTRLLPLLPHIEDADYWRQLTPGASIADTSFSAADNRAPLSPDERARYLMQLRTDGYLQTPVALSQATLDEMKRCVDSVMRAGFPPIFALVYDVFFQALGNFCDVLTATLGADYLLIPSFWVYHVSTSDDDRGFEPHRDAEYVDTLDADGLPRVLTAWIAITQATPLNGCIYFVPRGRDPDYQDAIHDLEKTASRYKLQDVRALPAQPGTMSCWDQYLFHWGSRSSQWAQAPRISYAMYFQRGDGPRFDPTAMTLSSPITFAHRLGIVCQGIMRYSHVGLRNMESARPLIAFSDKYTALLRPHQGDNMPNR